jgi:hypothetical protein
MMRETQLRRACVAGDPERGGKDARTELLRGIHSLPGEIVFTLSPSRQASLCVFRQARMQVRR